MQGVDDIISFWYENRGQRKWHTHYSWAKILYRVEQITGNSVAFSENFFNNICPTAKDILLR